MPKDHVPRTAPRQQHYGTKRQLVCPAQSRHVCHDRVHGREFIRRYEALLTRWPRLSNAGILLIEDLTDFKEILSYDTNLQIVNPHD